ncbi:MAG: hypothetical protein M1820_009929 [Bogoriella megaspora]|nr:MAG: hypothetical protein M1820_009929 [Bogoriella megaspora]
MASNGSLSLRILTHNIRYAAATLLPNEKPWTERRPLVTRQLQHTTRFLDGSAGTQGLSCICLQEVLHSQLKDILQDLNNLPSSESTSTQSGLLNGPTWAHIGVARDDGLTKGEYNPIIYPVRTLELLRFETVWLSPTPDKPSKGWDAGSRRILTIGLFEHRDTGRQLLACNTHLDNKGTVARTEGVKVVLDAIQRVRKAWKCETVPAFLAGDFNSFPTQEAYLEMVKRGQMADAMDFVPEEKRYGNEITFTGFQPDTDHNRDEIGRIDFIWLAPKDAVRGVGASDSSSWIVDGYAVLPNVFDDHIFSSDHRCVVADVACLSHIH